MSAARIFSVFISVLLLSSCAMNDRQRTQAEGAAAGCGVGAVIGNLIGKNTKATALGCAAFGMAGAAYGDHVADQKEGYATREDHFKAVIENGRQLRLQTESYNKQLNNEIAAVRGEIEQLKNTSDSVAVKNQKLSMRKQKTAELIKQAQQRLAAVQEEIAKQKSFVASNQQGISPDLVKVSLGEINQLESESRTLEIALAELRTIDNRRAY